MGHGVKVRMVKVSQARQIGHSGELLADFLDQFVNGMDVDLRAEGSSNSAEVDLREGS